MPDGSLYKPADRAAVLARIRRLTPESRPQWGEMTVSQMLAHAQAPLRVGLGTLRVKRGLVGLLFGRIVKKKLVGGAPFDRNLPTAKEFRIAEPRDFAVERESLVATIESFAAAGPANKLVVQHPFFGPLTSAEWDVLMWKHLDHHLRQFGQT
jgi:Protein of unknown function (DUF1569)